MTTKQIAFWSAVVVLSVMGGLAWFGLTPFGKVVVQEIQSIGSPSGSTFGTGKIAEQIITTGTTTAYSILNSDSSDRTIIGSDVLLANAMSTSTTFTVSCATSTTNASLGGNTNYIYRTTLATAVYGTTSGQAGLFIASSSPGLTGTSSPSSAFSPGIINPGYRNWPSGSYLNCLVTTSDTFSGFGSSTTGFIAFPYRGQ